MAIRLLVGLGNPGPEYEHTRHNVGAAFIEEAAKHFDIGLDLTAKFHGFVGRGVIVDQDVRLLVPTTFMNRSGLAVSAVAGFYKIALEEILIVYDEVAFEPGVARIKQGGGDNGHNGLKDIVRALGNHSEFLRLRLGVGHPGDKNLVAAYLTGRRMPASERELVDAAFAKAMRVLPDIIRGDVAQAMNRLHADQSSTQPTETKEK